MPEIDFAFLADAAETVPGQKFHVLGGGINRLGGPIFPLRHPHLAIVVSVVFTAVEMDREHQFRFVLLAPDGSQLAEGTSGVVGRGSAEGRDSTLTFAVDLWNLTFPAPGDYSLRLLVNGSERRRLPLVVTQTTPAQGTPTTLPSPPGATRYDA